jgi:hypothetical protein
VVDGVALIDRWRNERANLLDGLVPAPSDADRTGLSAVLDSLASSYDAVADVMVAEAVHQNVLGNSERAGAVLAALDRQETPPRMDFIRTRRTSKGFTHRVLVLLGDESLPPFWSGISMDVRARAEPRLNAWIARLIGDPRRFAFSASIGGAPTTLTATIAELNLSPLSLVMACEAPGNESRSELDERLAQLFASKMNDATSASAITLLDAAPSGSADGTIGLGPFRSLLRWTHALVTTYRAANANDLSLPQDGSNEGFDVTEIASRADAVSLAHTAAIAALDQLIASPPAVSAEGDPIREALWTAAGFGVRSAVPPSRGGSGAERNQLLAQVKRVVEEMRAASAREASLRAAFNADASATEAVAHHTDRVRALLDEHFPILPTFAARNAQALTASVGDRASLCGGDDLAPLSWLQRMALVRPSVGALSRVLLGSEMLQSALPPSSVLVAQLPPVAGEKWLALPFGANVPEAELSIASASSGVVDFGRPLAGLFCDAWPEAVPSREETTGMTFHYDAPGARPPQAILIAVPPLPPAPPFGTPAPPPSITPWSVDSLLETVIEARRLAPIRGVSPVDLRWLGTTLPPLWMPSAPSLDFGAARLDGPATSAPTPSTPTANVLGKV